MSVGRPTPRGARRGTRLVALASGLTALAATALAGSAAHAGTDPSPTTTYSTAQLAAVEKAVARADVAGTAWSVDDASGRVLLAVDGTVSAAAIDTITRGAGADAGALRVERLPGKLTRYLSGGDAIFSSDAAGTFRCSLGFNTQDNAGNYYFLTAGHCTNGTTDWYSDRFVTHIGTTTAGSSYPGNDYGRVAYDPGQPVPAGTVGDQDIMDAGDAQRGQAACRRGSTTGTHCGRVTGVNWSVRYPDGVVTGMIRTNICAEPGDSGGPLYAGSRALGLTSGGSGNCTTPSSVTFFQPVTEALNAFGVHVY